MSILERRGFLVGFGTLVFFTGFAADAWRNSISWYGYGAVIAAVVATSVVLIVVHRRDINFIAIPVPLVLFLLLAALSISWSYYPGASAIGVFAQIITTLGALTTALVLTRSELIRAMGLALRIILAGSLLFELWVSLVVRAPVLPVWVTAEDRVDPPKLLYWSRNLLLEGDKIQGIVGSSSLLAMAALLGLIVFGVQVASKQTRMIPGILWMALAVLLIGLTGSATIYLGLVAVVVVLVAILLVRRARTPQIRRTTYASIALSLVVLVSGAVLLRGPLLGVLGKNETLTGRLDIWNAVIALAQERPVAGWGWISFWAPWVEPFNDLVTKAGVVQLHAHNAWLDIWLQLGIIGLVVFGIFVAATAVRSWLLATDRVRVVPGDSGFFEASSLLAPLLLTALLVQSLAESRLLIEGGWILLVVLATTTKLGLLGAETPQKLSARRMA
jgi:O-antigen ligase